MQEIKLPSRVTSVLHEIEKSRQAKEAEVLKREGLIEQTGILLNRAKGIAATGEVREKYIPVGSGLPGVIGCHDKKVSYLVSPNISAKKEGTSIWLRVREEVGGGPIIYGKGVVIEMTETDPQKDEREQYSPLYVLNYNQVARDWEGKEVTEDGINAIFDLVEFMTRSSMEDLKQRAATRRAMEGLR